VTDPDLPVTAVLQELADHLAHDGVAVLCAPPGSGKTTQVPPAFMHMPWLDGQRIVMLEPRRVAARAAARYMAGRLGEAPGRRIGFRVRFESAVSDDTRVEVVTEGVLARRLQSDPELSGVGMVIFDEFHERSLECDLALALTLDVRAGLRPDLRVLVMSATLDAAPIAQLLGEKGVAAPIVRTEGRSYPVSVHYRPDNTTPAARISYGRDQMTRAVASAVREALTVHDNDLLVFLPGAREIHAVLNQLQGSIARDVLLCPLYGGLQAQAQDRAIMADANARQRVVLATNIAETSLTIDGVGVVIDSGLARRPSFDANTGLTRLRTVNISRASAEQRAGRAGRLGPGTAIRLWSESAHAARAAFDSAEISSADLCSLVLELARWGISDASQLRWLDAPPDAAWQQAVAMLQRLGALNDKAHVTPLGERMAALPTHPRLARMLCAAGNDSQRVLAANLAAALDGPDPAAGNDMLRRGIDLRDRADLLARWNPKGHSRNDAVQRTVRVADQLRSSMRADKTRSATSDHAGQLLLAGFPDRLAQRRSRARGQFVLANGRGLRVDEADSLAGSEYLVVPDLDAGAVDARAWRAAPIELSDIRDVLGGQIQTKRRVEWNAREQAVEAVNEESFGAIVLHTSPARDASSDELSDAMLDGVTQMGLACLPWTAHTRQLIERAESLRHWQPEGDWPALDEESLLADMPNWLLPFLAGITRRGHLARLDLNSILHTCLGRERLSRLEQGAPERLRVPSDSRIQLQYRRGEAPVLAVKLQEMFGASQTPTVCWGQIPVLVHLLSPAGRPLHVTQDLPSFWANAYPQVRKEMRGRYPKHPWPEDPVGALPTRHTKHRNRR
jgi:ATP-dependent helicase HrpB